jgi:hypothetical protein
MVKQMIDFSKYNYGSTVNVFICDSCIRKENITPKFPADSGTLSWLCNKCGHNGIGSYTKCKIGHWLILYPMHDFK